MYNAGGTSDDLFKSDFIVVWCSNPSLTHITDAHFMHEARYRGARLVVIAPDYSPTAVHADYWLNPRVGTDSALALAMAQVILSEGLQDQEYIREQTDLPILVREDCSTSGILRPTAWRRSRRARATGGILSRSALCVRRSPDAARFACTTERRWA
jgi:nitrate reductase alpha subunit